MAMIRVRHNKTLQPTLDPPFVLADARPARRDPSAAELGCYSASETGIKRHLLAIMAGVLQTVLFLVVKFLLGFPVFRFLRLRI